MLARPHPDRHLALAMGLQPVTGHHQAPSAVACVSRLGGAKQLSADAGLYSIGPHEDIAPSRGSVLQTDHHAGVRLLITDDTTIQSDNIGTDVMQTRG